jgi:hypothetical protein
MVSNSHFRSITGLYERFIQSLHVLRYTAAKHGWSPKSPFPFFAVRGLQCCTTAPMPLAYAKAYSLALPL